MVSLLPSATEIICSLGLEEQLVGVTHECDYPEWVSRLPRVTRSLIPAGAGSRQIDALVREKLQTQRALYTLDWPVLEQLCPDLLVTQALCDVCAVAEAEVRAAACALPGSPRVVNLEPQRLDDVFACIQQVAVAAGVPERAGPVVATLRERVARVARRSEQVRYRPRVVLLEWIDPPFCCGHWTPELVRLAGGREMLGQEGKPSRTLRWEEVRAVDPEVLVIACCGFDVPRALQDRPVLESYPGYEQLSAVRMGRVYWIDGNAYFSRPGPRLVDSLEWLAHLLHPDVHPAPKSSSNNVLVIDSPAAVILSHN
ncbi:MAG: cobalamin-binding protein [Gemmataceae bacterium]|nr:cobalamin-binding protein [Gemmataceae bacterium]